MLDMAQTRADWFSEVLPVNVTGAMSEEAVDNQTTVTPSLAITDLASVYLTANSSASAQSAILETGPSPLTKATDSGDLLGIATLWNTAEFNVVGFGSASEAILNLGTTLVVRTSIDGETANTSFCQATGFTAESNNLYLVPRHSDLDRLNPRSK
jgi:hypothetical protein